MNWTSGTIFVKANAGASSPRYSGDLYTEISDCSAETEFMSISFAQKREAFFLLVHAAIWGPQDERGLFDLIAEQLRVPVRDVRSNIDMASQLAQKVHELDEMIRESSLSHWETIGYTEKTVLRVILFEKLYGASLPTPVLLSEASRLAKKFTGNQSSSFIHGVLFTIFENLEKKDVEESDLEKKDEKRNEQDQKDEKKFDLEKKDVEESDLEKKDEERNEQDQKDEKRFDLEKKDVEESDLEKKDEERNEQDQKDEKKFDLEKKDVEESDLEKKDEERNEQDQKDEKRFDLEKKDVEESNLEKKDEERNEQDQKDEEKFDLEKKDVEKFDLKKKGVEEIGESDLDVCES